MTDLVTFGETPLRFSAPENQRLETARDATIYADGMTSNVAIAAQQLGAETLWLSKLPATPLGRRVATQIAEQGVETAVTWSEDHRQGLKFYESAQEPRESKYWYDRQGTAAASAEPADFPMDLVQSAEMLFTDLSTAVLSRQAAETSQALLRAGGGSGAVTAAILNYETGVASRDTYRGVFEELAGEIDVFFAREADVRTVFDRGGNARELANVLASEYGFDIVAIIRDRYGAVTLHNSPGTNVIHERSTIEADAVDPTGQRGAFVGAFLEELLSGSDAARSLSVAVATAALVRTIEGPFLTTAGNEIEPLVDRVIELSQ